LRKMGTPRISNVTVFIIAFYTFLEVIFDTAQSPCGKKLTIGKGIDSIFVAANANELLHIAIPWRHIVVANGPIDSEPVATGSFEVVVAPPLSLPCPHDALAANLVAADPIERFVLDIGM